MADDAHGSISERVNKFITKKFGIFHSQDNLTFLHRSLSNAAMELGFHHDLEHLADLIEKNGLTHEQEEILISILTVGETFFFRDMQTLNAFQDHILAPLLDTNCNPSKSLRIWSAGCCSGEEPYTLAILLTELLHEPDGWDIKILATDLNPQFLEKARKGIYTSWSLRNTKPEIIDRYFIRRGRSYELIPRIRKMVTFLQLNLVSQPKPEIIPHLINQNAVFCRNVLMYFSGEQISEVTKMLYDSTLENGWFVISPVEASLPFFKSYTPVVLQNITFFRKSLLPVTLTDQVIPKTIAAHKPAFHHPPLHGVRKFSPKHPDQKPVKDVVTDPSAVAVEFYSKGNYTSAIERILKIMDAGPANQELLPLLIRSYANTGKLEQARMWSEKQITLNKMDASSYYLHAVIMQEMALPHEAEKALVKALYLDPDHILSHLMMGNISARLGKHSKARKHYLNAEELLAKFNDTEVLPESEGMTAGRIKEMVGLMK
ncbi:MAG: CheR family methyltransferase [Bacteroidota bacterium]